MKVKENMVDVYGVMDIELFERLLVEKIMLSFLFDVNFVKRILIYVVINDKFLLEVRCVICILIERIFKVYEFLKLRWDYIKFLCL